MLVFIIPCCVFSSIRLSVLLHFLRLYGSQLLHPELFFKIYPSCTNRNIQKCSLHAYSSSCSMLIQSALFSLRTHTHIYIYIYIHTGRRAHGLNMQTTQALQVITIYRSVLYYTLLLCDNNEYQTAPQCKMELQAGRQDPIYVIASYNCCQRNAICWRSYMACHIALAYAADAQFNLK